MRLNTFFGFDIDQCKDANPHLRFRQLADGLAWIVTEKAAEKERPGPTGRPSQPCYCIGCTAYTSGKTIARDLGWSLDQVGRAHLCPDCQRKRIAKLAATI